MEGSIKILSFSYAVKAWKLGRDNEATAFCYATNKDDNNF